ncbi:lysophospholipid acyltransferase family protein [Williamsia maris]|uniref:1-acyl-sn-glycerol-3-phosphate acyltransferases n=1 Tax=Williamsia maris TaxID=72806 RepID=A0ABT1HHP3_9NOCA|nr:lysophospholipid acyltransferase family protein [Williamsia maris]MCP2177228.1 1-acyl-sn-glycerol-3-phosphate acyltransferases [Williamsia maris]
MTLVDTAPTRRAHAWFPVSPCDASCVPATARTHDRVRTAIRLLRVVATICRLVPAGAIVTALPRPVRRRFTRHAARSLLAALGIAVQVDDRRPFVGRGAGLIVANHTSFLDILAIASVVPARFVAKSELLAWPVVGTLARRLGVIGIDRESLRSLPGTVDAAVAGLHSDDAVGVFPEGTTWCGRTGGTFRPAMFQAAVDAAVPVIPMHVGFRGPGDEVSTAASFIGDDDLLDTMRRVISATGLSVRVRVHELQLPGPDRRELARRCERLVFGPMVLPPLPTVNEGVHGLSLAG